MTDEQETKKRKFLIFFIGFLIVLLSMKVSNNWGFDRGYDEGYTDGLSENSISNSDNCMRELVFISQGQGLFYLNLSEIQKGENKTLNIMLDKICPGGVVNE